VVFGDVGDNESWGRFYALISYTSFFFDVLSSQDEKAIEQVARILVGPDAQAPHGISPYVQSP
jgi:hypothetical protein